MIVQVFTIAFNGAGTITCRRCSHKTVFRSDQSLLMLDNGLTTLVRSVLDLSVVHRCGRERYWLCGTCGHEQDVDTRTLGRRSGPRWECDVCGGELVARTRDARAGEDR